MHLLYFNKLSRKSQDFYFLVGSTLSDPSHFFLLYQNCFVEFKRRYPLQILECQSRKHFWCSLWLCCLTALLLHMSALCWQPIFLCLRVGEIAKSSNVSNMITLQQVSSVTVWGTIVANLFQFTEYKHQKGHKPILRLETQSKGKFCPVKCLTQYWAVRTNAPGPLFITKSAMPITRLQFWTVLKKCLNKLSRDAANFGMHSFRIGRCTDMVRDGYSDEKIKKIGRWKSTAFRAYNRPEVVCAWFFWAWSLDGKYFVARCPDGNIFPSIAMAPTARPDQCLQCYAWLKNVFSWKLMLGIDLIL